MIQTPSGKLQAGSYLFRLQVKDLIQDLVGAQARRQQVQHVADPAQGRSPHYSGFAVIRSASSMTYLAQDLNPVKILAGRFGPRVDVMNLGAAPAHSRRARSGHVE